MLQTIKSTKEQMYRIQGKIIAIGKVKPLQVNCMLGESEDCNIRELMNAHKA